MDRGKYVVIMLRDDYDHERIKRRMEICKNLIEHRAEVEDIHTEGKGLLARMFSTIYLGDLTSYYLALMNKVDPTPVPIVEDLKKRL